MYVQMDIVDYFIGVVNLTEMESRLAHDIFFWE